MHNKALVSLALLLALSTYGIAQKNELALSIGAATASSQQTTLIGITCPLGVACNDPFTSNTDTGVAFEGVYSRQFFNLHAASLGAEFPLVGAPSRNVNTQIGFLPHISIAQSSLFFAPSARVRFLLSSAISPFFSVGGGLAHLKRGGVAVNRWTLQVGGGVDFKTPIPHVTFRGEVRDFWSTGVAENSGIALISPPRQHNVFVGAGIVLRF
jgi:hypothetical protein